MGWIVLFGLIAWPILEIYVFIQVGEALGWLSAVLLFLGAGAVGLWLLRAEGISLLLRARGQMQQGIAPLDEAFDALCLVMGGVLLLLPGFITDIAALLLFLPPTRAALRRLVARHAVVRTGREHRGPMPHTVVIEGEFEDVTAQPSDPSKVNGPANDAPRDPAADIVRKPE